MSRSSYAQGDQQGKLLSPEKKRRAAQQLQEMFDISQRRACQLISQPRATQRYERILKNDEAVLVKRMIELTKQYGRYGYRRITALLQSEGFRVNHKRVERLWRREGLKVPQKQPKRKRLWLNDGSCVRLRPRYKNHVWSYDFVLDRTHNGKAIRMLTVIDEHTRKCLAIETGRKLNSQNVMDVLSQLFIERGTPQYIRSDNGPEFIAKRLRWWLKRHKINILFIEPGSPWENGYIESFNGKLRDELLEREVFDTLLEAKVLIERWRHHYNTVRPHSSLSYRPPAPETIQPRWLNQQTLSHKLWYT